jgi:hypothetical protein
MLSILEDSVKSVTAIVAGAANEMGNRPFHRSQDRSHRIAGRLSEKKKERSE